MKRQNSTTSEDDHSRTSIDSNNNNHNHNRSNVYPLEMMSSPTSMATPPYNRNNIGSHGGGRRRKKLSYSNSGEMKSDDRTKQTQRQMQPLLSSPGGVGSSIMSSANSPTGTAHDALHNTPSSSSTSATPNTIVNLDQDTSKTRKKSAPPPHHNPLLHLLSTLQYKLSTKVRYYRKKLSTLSPRQKVVLCTLLIVWKFIQAWLIVRGFVWLSGGTTGGGGSGGEGEGVVHVGQSMEQRLKLEEELKVEIELSKEKEDRLEEQLLWMDRNDEGGKAHGGSGKEWIEDENGIGNEKRILYMLTVTCSTQQEQEQAPRAAAKESLSTHQQQQRRDGTATNQNDNGRNLNSSREDTTTTNIDSILSTLSTNIQTMIDHPEGYTVDVYWILGCAWSDYFGDTMPSLSSVTNVGEEQSTERLDSLDSDEKVSEYWNEYIARQLPDGVGLQLWEDAMPLDYPPKIIGHHGSVGDSSRESRGKDELNDFLARKHVGGGGTRGLSRTIQQGQTQHQIQHHRRLQEESNVRIVNVVHHQGQKTSHLHSQFKMGAKNGVQDHSTATLAPSIDKFMKQHRYVVRDKLDYYDVFLSFGASLQRYHSHIRPSGDLVSVNGTSIEFCAANLFRDTEIRCSDRVEYLMKHYGITRSAAMVSLLKEKDCICTAVNEGRGDDLKAIIPSQPLERITGDHIHTFLSMSSELNELPDGQHIIPGLVSVDTVSSIAAESISTLGTQQFRVNASPCCGSDSMELTVETKGGGAAINTDEWQMMKVETEISADGDKDKAKEEAEAQQPQPSLFEWIAVERKSGDATTPPTFNFYEDGWVLTKDQLLRLNFGSNRGKFLPPFTNGNIVHNNSIRRQGLASPLFDSVDDGGLCLHRAISLDPNRFSRQLIRHPVSRPYSKNAPLGVKELLRLFYKAKDEM